MERLLEHLAGAQAAWLAAGVGLHVANQAARGLAWSAALAPLHAGAPAPCPRRVAAAWIAGAGVSGVLSSRGGDAVRLGLVRRLVPGAPWAALGGTLAVEGIFEMSTGAAIGAWAASRGLGGAGIGWVPLLLPLVAVLALAAAALAPRPRAWLRARGRELGRGLGLLRRPRAYARQVLPLCLLSRVLRFASLACFLAAFGLPVAAAAIACVAATQGSARVLPVPGAAAPAGAGLLVLAFAPVTGLPAEPAALAALGLGVPALLTAVGLLVSGALALWLLGTTSPRQAWRALRPAAAPR